MNSEAAPEGQTITEFWVCQQAKESAPTRKTPTPCVEVPSFAGRALARLRREEYIVTRTLDQVLAVRLYALTGFIQSRN